VPKKSPEMEIFSSISHHWWMRAMREWEPSVFHPVSIVAFNMWAICLLARSFARIWSRIQ